MAFHRIPVVVALALVACHISLGQADTCNANDLRKFGAVMNKNSDDTAALKRADSSSTTTYIYADKWNAAGVLNIKSSLTLTKPLVTGRFLGVKIAAGATLKLTAQPRFPRGRIISGDGKVVLSGAGPYWVLHEWWMGYNSNTNANVGLEAAKAACASTKCYLVISGQARLSKPFYLSPNLILWGSSGSSIIPQSSATAGLDGLVFGAGTYTSQLTLPSLSGFSGAAMTVKGTTGLRAYVPRVGDGTTGVRFATASNAKTVAGTQVEAFIMSNLANGVNVASHSGEAITSSSFYSNFLLKTKSGTASALLFSGGAPKLTDFSVEYSAIDGANTASSFSFVRSTVSGTISNFAAGITAWAGGFTGTTSFVTGKFNNMALVMKVSAAISKSVLTFSGSGNSVSWDAAWNRDKSYAMSSTRTKNPAASSLITSNYAVITFSPTLLSSSWPAGATRTFYINHLMANGGMGKILLGPGRLLPATNFIVNPGIVVYSVKDVGSKNIQIVLKNTLKRSITKADLSVASGNTYSLYFNLMIGVMGLV